MIFDLIEKNDGDGLTCELSTTSPDWVNEFNYSALHIALSRGLDEIAEIIINAGIDVNLNDAKGQTALQYCAFYNKPALAKLIIQIGGTLDIEDKFGNQPLWTAIMTDKGFGSHVEIVRIFIEPGADRNHLNHVKKTLW